MTFSRIGASWAGYPPIDWVPPPRSSRALAHARARAVAHDPTLRAFVDTEVLVAAVDTADPDRRLVARGILSLDAYSEIVTSAQVLSEFHTAVRRLAVPVDEQVALALVRELVREATVVPVTAADVLAAISVATATIGPGLASGEELTLRDALVVRAALAAGCDVLLTRRVEDGTRYVGLDGRGGPEAVAGDGGLVVEDPFV